MLFDREKGVMYELNETASAICQALVDSGGGTIETIASILSEEFEADLDELTDDVAAFVSDFVGIGLLDCEATPL